MEISKEDIKAISILPDLIRLRNRLKISVLRKCPQIQTSPIHTKKRKKGIHISTHIAYHNIPDQIITSTKKHQYPTPLDKV